MNSGKNNKKIKRKIFLRRYQQIVKLSKSLKSITTTLIGFNLVTLTLIFSFYENPLDVENFIILLTTSFMAFIFCLMFFSYIEIKAYSIEYNSRMTLEKLKRIHNLYRFILIPDLLFVAGLISLTIAILDFVLYYFPTVLFESLISFLIIFIIVLFGFILLLRFYKPDWDKVDLSIIEEWEDYET